MESKIINVNCNSHLPEKNATLPGGDPTRFPPFYVKRSDFLKLKVNFPSHKLETWPISCQKNLKA